MPWRGATYPGELPTLGYDVLDWIERYLIVPDGPAAGEPLRFYDEQAAFVIRYYAIDPGFDGPIVRGNTFFNARRVRRAIFSRPKGFGKSPMLAALLLAEAIAPVVFDGWDADGEPVGRPWHTLGFKPKTQLTAAAEDQTANTWDPLLEMARNGNLADDYWLDVMETFVLVERGKIDYTTTSASAREGYRPVFAAFDQALALDTPIPTPSGWTVMGALRVGDVVVGSAGQPVRVIEVKPVSVEHDCFRVHFADGTSVVASAGHLWATKVAGSAAAPKVRTTAGMLADGRRFRVPVCPTTVSPERPLPVPAYLLGLWLGDGTRGKCELSVHSDDLAAVQAALRVDGVASWPRRYRVSGGYSPGGDQVNLTFSRGSGYQSSARPEVAKAMAALPCYRDKHVPADYLTGSVPQRVALLQGLMDSDGSVTRSGCCTFVNTNARLADAVVGLLRSLGQVASGAKWVAEPRYSGGGRWRVDFTPRGGLVPFRLPRKAGRVRQHRNGSSWVSIVRIEPVERVPVRCIAVDSDDHLFAAGPGRHLTHNTESWTPANGGPAVAASVRRNLAKTQGSSVEAPNAYKAGLNSVSEKSYKAAALQREGRTRGADGGILLDHREMPAETDPTDPVSLRAGLLVAYGDAAAENGGHVNLDRIIEDYYDPDTEPSDARQFYGNQVSEGGDVWLTSPEWTRVRNRDRGNAQSLVGSTEPITLGFDGSRSRNRGVTDATALIGCRVRDGHLFQIAVWEQPPNWPKTQTWRAPIAEILAAVDDAFTRYKVVGFYADPAKWESHVASWEAKYGADLKVKATRQNPIEWWMTGGRNTATIRALKSFRDAIQLAEVLPGGEIRADISHDGSSELTRHALAAYERTTPAGIQIAKEHPDSPRKIDAVVAAVLAYQARLDAIAAGVLVVEPSGFFLPRRIR